MFYKIVNSIVDINEDLNLTRANSIDTSQPLKEVQADLHYPSNTAFFQDLPPSGTNSQHLLLRLLTLILFKQGLSKIVSEYDQEIPQSQTPDKPHILNISRAQFLSSYEEGWSCVGGPGALSPQGSQIGLFRVVEMQLEKLYFLSIFYNIFIIYFICPNLNLFA